MDPSLRNDLALALAAALLVLWYLWGQPLALGVELDYRAQADGSAAFVLGVGESKPQRSGQRAILPIRTQPSQGRASARIALLTELPARARLELRLPLGSELTIRGLRLSVRHPLMRGAYTAVAEDVLALKGVRPIDPVAGGLGLRQEAEGAQVEISLAGLQARTELEPGRLLLWLFFGLALFGLLRLLRRLPQDEYPKLYVYGLFYAFFLFQALFYVAQIPPGKAPDERAHISYIAHLEETGRWYPDFERMPIYLWSGKATEDLSYLGHPPLYYLLFTPFSGDSAPAVMRQWHSLRLLNLGLAAAGLALLFWLVMRLRLPLPFHFLYALSLSSIPMLPYLAASVNNDNLAIFSGAVLLAGALAAMERNAGARWLLGLGLCSALLAKVTVGLQAGVFVILLLVALWRGGATPRELAAHFALPLVLGAALPLAYHGYTIVHYGKLLPIFGKTAYTRQPGMEPLPFLDYLEHFLRYLRLSWAGIVSHQDKLPRAAWHTQTALFLLPLAALGGLLIPIRSLSSPARHLFLVAKLGVLTLLVFALVHFAKVYSSHQHTAYLGGIQARYYFPFAACLVLTALLPLYRWRDRVWTTLAGLLAAASLLYSNLFVYIAAQL